jgi:hypothetical protein
MTNENITTAKTADLPTYATARKAVDSCLNAYQDSKQFSDSDSLNAWQGITEGVQIRDYALGAIGLTLNSPQDSIYFIKSLIEKHGENAPLLSLLGAYTYEAQDSAGALIVLNKALELDDSHSLTKLLMRVMHAGWPCESFVSMRNELHPKVTEGLAALSRRKVGNE